MTGEQIRVRRINAGYSVRGLGRHLDIAEQTIRRLEGGQGISLESAKKIADFFEVQVTDLLPQLLEEAA